VQREAETFAAFYRHHEHALIRYVQRTVRSPEVTAELAAETFALALRVASSFDPAREPPAAWLFAIADRVLLRRARTGAVDDSARRALKLHVCFDDRALRRIDTLGEAALTLPELERALSAAADRRELVRRRRGRLRIGARALAAVASVLILIAGVVAPDAPPARSSTVWLPYAIAGVEGEFPASWHQASGREVLFTTFDAGADVSRALAVMGPTDAVVYKRRIVIGRKASRRTREQAREIVRRMRSV
jgi:DNA-directed RNA polymerase specialized sigma24 family protein